MLHYRRLITAVLICLVGLSNSIAQGVMPVASEDGLAFVICSQSGPLKVRILSNGDMVPDDTEDGDDASGRLCPWAYHGAVHALVSPFAGDTDVLRAAKSEFGAEAEDLAAFAKLSNYDSRGPPHFFDI